MLNLPGKKPQKWARWQAPHGLDVAAAERRFLARYLQARRAIDGRRLEPSAFVATIERAAARWQRRHAVDPPHRASG